MLFLLFESCIPVRASCMPFLSPLPTLAAVPACQGSWLAASCLLLACDSPESSNLRLRATHRDIKGSQWQNQRPALCRCHIPFLRLTYLPVPSHDFHLPWQLWSQQWGWLILTCECQDRSFHPGWEVAVAARTFVGCDFAPGQLEAHLCDCLVLLAGEGSPGWHKAERPARGDSRTCPLSCTMAKCRHLIMFQHFPF